MKHNKNVNVKIVAYYLPQYHQIPENDMWWGEGFTEWTTVKNALPLWYGHKQPKVPFNDYYYDLTERSTMDWQAGLMKHYGIDGWCLYHYWFKDGEKILETPAENLLKWKDIDISYCFCWANESWARTWSNLTDKNSWGEIVETEDKKPGDSGILLKQSYGLEEEWTDHFYYLLPFFQDKRYIRIDNKPIFVIYKPAIIPCLLAMKDCWDELAKDAGLGGICLIYLAGKDEAFDKDVQYAQRSPFSSECLTKIDKCGVRRYSYDKTWESILSNNNKKCFYTGFSGFDDTPRRGVYGSVFDGASPQKLQSYMISMLSKSASEGKEFVFFNAWNEWGEGMYLEPDKENGFKMLEAVKNAKSLYMTNSNVMVPLYTENKEKQKKTEDSLLKRTQHNLEILDRWLYLKESNSDMYCFFHKYGIRKIIIYGYNILGKHLIEELRNSDIEVCAVVDKKVDCFAGESIASIKKIEFNDVDAVVVTAVNYFGEIYENLKEITSCRIINFEQILTDI